MICIRYFGQVKTITSIEQELIDYVPSLKELKNTLFNKYPELANMTFVFSVNHKITEQTSLQENDEVALLPPFSGG